MTEVVVDQLFVIKPQGSFVMWPLRARADLSLVMFAVKAMDRLAITNSCTNEDAEEENKQPLPISLEEMMDFD